MTRDAPKQTLFQIDVIFLLDSSDVTENLNHIKDLVRSIANCLDIAPDKIGSLILIMIHHDVFIIVKGSDGTIRINELPSDSHTSRCYVIAVK